jgi:hypothetical protein
MSPRWKLRAVPRPSPRARRAVVRKSGCRCRDLRAVRHTCIAWRASYGRCGGHLETAMPPPRATGQAALVSRTKNSPSRWRFRQPHQLTFRSASPEGFTLRTTTRWGFSLLALRARRKTHTTTGASERQGSARRNRSQFALTRGRPLSSGSLTRCALSRPRVMSRFHQRATSVRTIEVFARAES